MPEQTFTKAEAISEFSSLIRDLEADARLDDSAVDRGHEWNAMVKTWRKDGRISAETAAAWIASGPRLER